MSHCCPPPQPLILTVLQTFKKKSAIPNIVAIPTNVAVYAMPHFKIKSGPALSYYMFSSHYKFCKEINVGIDPGYILGTQLVV